MAGFHIKELLCRKGGTKVSLHWRLALLVWIILGVALTIKGAFLPNRQTVFGVYQSGVNHWWLDQSVYAKYPGVDLFRYAPSSIFLLNPVVQLGPTVGPILWSWFSILVLLLACWRMAGKLWPKESDWAIGSLVMLFCALSGLWNHQSNAIIGSLLVLGCVDIWENKFMRGALFFTLALVLKTTVLPVILLLMVSRPWALSWRLGLLGLVALLVPFLTRPPDIVLWQYQEWWKHLQLSHDLRWPGYRDAWYFILTLAEWIRPGSFNPLFWDCSPPPVYQYLQMGTGLGILFLVVRWAKKKMVKEEWYPRTLCLGLIWLMVFGPATELATYGLIAPMLCWVQVKAKHNRAMVTAAFVGILFLSWRELTGQFAPYFPPIYASAPIGSALLGIWLINDSESILDQPQSKETENRIQSGKVLHQ